MRIHLSYADQNEEFGRAFPIDGLDGTALRRLALKDWGDDWYLVELEGTFEYEGRRHDRVLVRSLGGKESWRRYNDAGVHSASARHDCWTGRSETLMISNMPLGVW